MLIELFIRIIAAGLFLLCALKIKSNMSKKEDKRLIRCLKSALFLFFLYNILFILELVDYLPGELEWLYNFPKLIATVMMIFAVIDFTRSKNETRVY